MPAPGECWDGNNFAYFHPTGAELEGQLKPTEALLDQLGELDGKIQVEHQHMIDVVEGEISAVAVGADEPVTQQLKRDQQNAAFVAAALKLLGEWNDMANHGWLPWTSATNPSGTIEELPGGYPVQALNEAYRVGQDSDFGLNPDDFPSGQEYEEALLTAYVLAFDELCWRWHQLDEWVDTKAYEVSAMIERGHNEADVRELFRSRVIGIDQLNRYFLDYPQSTFTQEDWLLRVEFRLRTAGCHPERRHPTGRARRRSVGK